jgi:hypothetical protein
MVSLSQGGEQARPIAPTAAFNNWDWLKYERLKTFMSFMSMAQAKAGGADLSRLIELAVAGDCRALHELVVALMPVDRRLVAEVLELLAPYLGSEAQHELFAAADAGPLHQSLQHEVMRLTARIAFAFPFFKIPAKSFGGTSLLQDFGARLDFYDGKAIFLISGRDLPEYSLGLEQDLITEEVGWKTRRFNSSFHFVLTRGRIAIYSRQYGTLVVNNAAFSSSDNSRVASPALWHPDPPQNWYVTLRSVEDLRERGYFNMYALLKAGHDSTTVKMAACLEGFHQLIQFFQEWMCATIPVNNWSVFDGYTRLKGLHYSPGFQNLLDKAECALDSGFALRLLAFAWDQFPWGLEAGGGQATLTLDDPKLAVLQDLHNGLDVLYEEDPHARQVMNFLHLASDGFCRIAVTD